MTKRLVAMIAALMLSGVGGAFAQDSLAMKIVSFTGQIQIKTPDGSVVGVVPGAPIPNIPPGAEIQVLSGDAVFQTGQTVVKANAGDAFTFSAPPSAGGAPQQVQIAAVGDKTELQIVSGKTEATVGKGQTLGVTSVDKGPVQFQAVKGDIPVVDNGKASTLQQGASLVAATPAAAPAPAPAPVVKPAAPAAKTTAPADTTTEVISPVEPLPPPPPPNPVQEEQTASPSAP